MPHNPRLRNRDDLNSTLAAAMSESLGIELEPNDYESVSVMLENNGWVVTEESRGDDT